MDLWPVPPEAEGRLDMTEKRETDFWTPDNMTFVTGGQGYCVGPHGGTVCIGPVDNTGKPISNALVSVQDAREVVSKLPDNEIIQGINIHAQETTSFETFLKHPGGRPRKSGEVSRATKWRREKELQGVLI